jgi:hypothetical protein
VTAAGGATAGLMVKSLYTRKAKEESACWRR